jgi:putative tricarboxylic transport membrane protein
MIFEEHGPLVYAVFAGLVISKLFLLGSALLAVNTIAPSLCNAPKKFLFPIILVCCYVGSFAVTTKAFDIKIMLACGLLGYFMRKTGFPAAPLLIGFILGLIDEQASTSL